MADKQELPPIIIKKVKKVAAGHHGGAWKVAYADFVTAMMAFFLLLWLLNVANDDARKIISSYFDPSHPRVSESTNGAGGVMGGTSISREGSMTTNLQQISNPDDNEAMVPNPRQSKESETEEADLEKLEEELKKREDERFKEAEEKLRKAIEENEELKDLAEHLLIDITPEGLRIQIIDQDRRPLFPSGSATMYEYTKELIGQVSIAINTMPNNISVRGHTDGHKYAAGALYTNWELSADRANASRRELVNASISKKRIANVIGKSDQDPLIKEDTFAAQNRRISIVLLRETIEEALERGEFTEEDVKEITAHDSYSTKFDHLPHQSNTPIGTFKQTPGNVYFP